MGMQKTKIAQSVNLQELLLEEGEDFVEAAFLALLKRRPDANGGRIYLRALRNGTRRLTTSFAGSQGWRKPITPGGRSTGCTSESSSMTRAAAVASYFTSAVTHNSQPPPPLREDCTTSLRNMIFCMFCYKRVL